MTPSLHEVIEKSISAVGQILKELYFSGYRTGNAGLEPRDENILFAIDRINSSQLSLLESVVKMCDEMKNHDEMVEMAGVKYTIGFEKALDDFKILLQEEIKKLK